MLRRKKSSAIHPTAATAHFRDSVKAEEDQDPSVRSVVSVGRVQQQNDGQQQRTSPKTASSPANLAAESSPAQHNHRDDASTQSGTTDATAFEACNTITSPGGGTNLSEDNRGGGDSTSRATSAAQSLSSPVVIGGTVKATTASTSCSFAEYEDPFPAKFLPDHKELTSSSSTAASTGTCSNSRSPPPHHSSTLSFRDMYEEDTEAMEPGHSQRRSDERHHEQEEIEGVGISDYVCSASEKRKALHDHMHSTPPSFLCATPPDVLMAPSPAPSEIAAPVHASSPANSTVGTAASSEFAYANPTQSVKIVRNSTQQLSAHTGSRLDHSVVTPPSLPRNSLLHGDHGTVASSVASSTTHSPHNSLTNQPVLYSAIGSLEDPSGVNSFSKRYYRQQTIKKPLEFRNQLQHLLPPPNQVTSSQKSASGVGNAATATSSISEQRAGTRKNDSRKQDSREVATSSQGHDSHAPHNPTPASALVSNLRKSKAKSESVVQNNKKVTISAEAKNAATRQKPQPSVRKSKKSASNKKKPSEMFRPSSDAYTPRMGKKVIKYKQPEMRTPIVEKMASPLGTLSRPNFRDALRRVAMILHQHIVKITRRFENKTLLEKGSNDGLFHESMRDSFCEDRYVTPTYRCTMVRVPMARPGMVYGLKKNRIKRDIPTEAEIYDFAHRLFKSVQLSSECSIVCLIYVERLMETAKVPLLADTWRPIFMCGLLLASKVWQDLSSWNIEFATVYPQYSLDSINKLELQFLRSVKWDLYISSSCYAKYYFALRSLVEKPDFRQRYNRMVAGVNNVSSTEALKIEKRSSMVKEEALLQLSRSM